MIKCIAIDDEPLALDLIKKMCQDIPFVCLDKIFTQASLAKRYLSRNSCDLIFLDIQMPDVNGVDFFKSLDQQPEVIFTTAFADYAVEGFEVKAVDYLLKPINPARFRSEYAGS
jgi:DNA-binding LytR/AlgR family response regulator